MHHRVIITILLILSCSFSCSNKKVKEKKDAENQANKKEYPEKRRRAIKDTIDERVTIAASAGNLEEVKSLIAPITNKEDKKSVLNHGLLSSISGNLETMQFFVQQGADIETRDETDNTPLMNAASAGNLAMVQYLVEQGADFNATNRAHHNVLIKAMEGMHIDVVKYLVKKGVDTHSASEWAERTNYPNKNILLLFQFECSICRQEYRYNVGYYQCPNKPNNNCFQIFCEKCFKKWSQQQTYKDNDLCPYCRLSWKNAKISYENKIR